VHRIFYRCVVLVCCILINSCSTHRDGPPSYYVDDSKIPNAVPKVEPLAKYGNMAHYKVFGKQYYVMNSSHNYEEQGIASWYGSKFHNHLTSSGENYNMLSMTAAHKTLPLPTYVRVTNLANGRQVIVKVNDRGPFEANRIIDLSYVAAKKLGMLGHGTARVDVKAIDPSEAAMHPEMIAVKTPSPHNNFLSQPAPLRMAQNKPPVTSAQRSIQRIVNNNNAKLLASSTYIQVGAFRNLQHAEKLKSILAGLVSSPIAINSFQDLYRVQVGPFKDLAAADRVNKVLKSVGLHTEKVNDIA
jgi:rare lipoprotein A